MGSATPVKRLDRKMGSGGNVTNSSTSASTASSAVKRQKAVRNTKAKSVVRTSVQNSAPSNRAAQRLRALDSSVERPQRRASCENTVAELRECEEDDTDPTDSANVDYEKYEENKDEEYLRKLKENKSIPRNLTVTQEELATRKVMDQRRWLCLARV